MDTPESPLEKTGNLVKRHGDRRPRFQAVLSSDHTPIWYRLAIKNGSGLVIKANGIANGPKTAPRIPYKTGLARRVLAIR
jgi:hypothetical protein